MSVLSGILEVECEGLTTEQTAVNVSYNLQDTGCVSELLPCVVRQQLTQFFALYDTCAFTRVAREDRGGK